MGNLCILMTSVFLYNPCTLWFAAWVFCACAKLPTSVNTDMYKEGFKYYFSFLWFYFCFNSQSHMHTVDSVSVSDVAQVGTRFLTVLLSCMIVFIWICLHKTRGDSWPAVKYRYIYPTPILTRAPFESALSGVHAKKPLRLRQTTLHLLLFCHSMCQKTKTPKQKVPIRLAEELRESFVWDRSARKCTPIVRGSRSFYLFLF